MARFSLITCLAVALQAASTFAADVAKRPNILFAISDDQSYPHCSAYGNTAVKTPAFDRIAEMGVLFHQAFSGSPGCSPSRACILTGRYPWQLEHAGTHASSFSAKYEVFPDLLETAGYAVGYTGKGWGPNYKDGGRSRNPAGPDFSKLKLPETPPGIRSTDYSGNFEAFLETRKEGQPFCFWYGSSEPHRVFKKGIGREQGKRLEEAVVPPFLPDTPEIRSDILDYSVEIEWFDKHLARMLSRLRELGELENTLIIATSDNGMAFPRAKANVYEYGIHLPLAISWPERFSGGKDSHALVSFVDFAPTILEAAGVRLPQVYPMTGVSLLTHMSQKEPAATVDGTREAVFSGRERHSSSRYQNWTHSEFSTSNIFTFEICGRAGPAGVSVYDQPGQLWQ